MIKVKNNEGEQKMKTKQEIEEKLKIYEQIKDNSGIFTSEFSLASGAIAALEWVLQKTQQLEKARELKVKEEKWRE